MKTFGVRKGVLVYKGPDPVGKMEIPGLGWDRRNEQRETHRV